MRQKKIVSGAVVMALGLMLAGCSGGKASFSEAPQTEFKELRDGYDRSGDPGPGSGKAH